MAKLTMEEAKDFLVLPKDSILDLKVEEVNETEVNGRNGTWQKLGIKFKILGIQAVGDGTPPSGYQDLITEHIFGSVPLKLTDSPDNRLRQWTEAILRIEIGVGFELDTDMFKGRFVRGVSGVWMKKVGTDEYPRHQIEALLPAQDQAVATPVQTAPANWGGAPQADPWATPAAAAAPTAAQQDPWAAPAATGQPAAQDPWGDWGGDEPPF